MDVKMSMFRSKFNVQTILTCQPCVALYFLFIVPGEKVMLLKGYTFIDIYLFDVFISQTQVNPAVSQPIKK
jgi:hypothetical protein